MKRVAAALVLIVGLGACASDDPGVAPATSDETETTVQRTDPPETDAPTTEPTDPPETDPETTPPTEPETTPPTEAPTSTAAATTTVAEFPIFRGIVWRSAVDPARVNTQEPPPEFSENGVTSSIDILALVPAAESGACRDTAREYRQDMGGELATQCLYVQWRFSVATDIDTEYSEEATLRPEDLVTSAGIQVERPFASMDAYPGTVDNVVSVLYPFGDAASTIRWSTHDGGYNESMWVFDAPAEEAFKPLNFDMELD